MCVCVCVHVRASVAATLFPDWVTDFTRRSFSRVPREPNKLDVACEAAALSGAEQRRQQHGDTDQTARKNLVEGAHAQSAHTVGTWPSHRFQGEKKHSAVKVSSIR